MNSSNSSNQIWVKRVSNGGNYLVNGLGTPSVLRFNFLNCTIDLDLTRYGAYAICPGCGSGKTTNIKNLISQVWSEGVLYSAFTKAECNDMYQYCKSLVGSTSTDKSNNVVTLKEEDIIVLHSDFSADGVDNNLWRNNPEELGNKKIIICTHHKLMNEPFHLFMRANFNPSASYVMGKLRASVCGLNDSSLPRQWILIDENPESNMESKVIKRWYLRTLILHGRDVKSAIASIFDKIGDREKGKRLAEMIPIDDSAMIDPDGCVGKFIERVMDRVKSDDEALKSFTFKELNELDSVKNEYLLESLYYNLWNLITSGKGSDLVTVSYSIMSLISPYMMTRILLFDGTSDITLSSSDKLTLATVDKKYNSPVNIDVIPFNVPRVVTKKVIEGKDPDEWMRDKMDEMACTLSEVIKSNNRTLIYTWKNFKGEKDDLNDDGNELSKLELKNLLGKKDVRESIVINKDMSIPGYLKYRLGMLGFVEGINYSIEYYGSGRDKATNDYRDYDAVVLLGRYIVPGRTIESFNLMYGTNINEIEYYSNRVVQAVCRTRIRNHTGEPINLYFSNDWDNEIIAYVDTYLNNGERTYFSSDSVDRYDELRSMGLTPKKAQHLSKLCKYDKNVIKSLRSKSEYTINISLGKIYEIIPMSRKEIDRYQCLINWLRKLGIILNIY